MPMGATVALVLYPGQRARAFLAEVKLGSVNARGTSGLCRRVREGSLWLSGTRSARPTLPRPARSPWDRDPVRSRAHMGVRPNAHICRTRRRAARALLQEPLHIHPSDVRDPPTEDVVLALAPRVVDSHRQCPSNPHPAEIRGHHEELWIWGDAVVVVDVPGHNRHHAGSQVEHVGDPRRLHHPLAVTLPTEADDPRVFAHRACPSSLSGAGCGPTATGIVALVTLRGSRFLLDVKVEICSRDSPRPWRPGTLGLQRSSPHQSRDRGERNTQLASNLLHSQFVVGDVHLVRLCAARSARRPCPDLRS